ncbi:MAG: exodeoxyribonuclease VII large subunit, partial [Eggerthellaceae bacterium]|nr:exodeoxyribonuclease VII large subunit [Eggerthellaceae bacterium]
MTLVDDVAHARKPEVLSVTQAVEKLNKILSFDDYIVEGEISEFQDKGWANVYFTLKDSTTGASSIMRCAMWTNAYRNQKLPLDVGMKIEAVGRFEVYAPKGDMSFRVSKFSIAGRGDLRAQVEALAKKLRSEGLTDESRKRPIPAFPEMIGLVTSPRGAVVHDMLRTLKRRWPLAVIKVAGVPVEGKTAPEKMKEGIAACIAAGCEVILLGRGGGSFEDLMPFNDEQLARAVAASPVPIITAVGHEIDTTICDLVSDKRASTPTMAAGFASAFSNEDMLHEISFRADKLTRDMKRRFESSYSVLQGIQNKKYFADAHELYSDDLNYLDMNYEKIRTMLATFL